MQDRRFSKVLKKIQVFSNVKPQWLLNMGFFKLWRCEDACQSEQTYPSSALILGLRRAIGQRYSYRRSTWRNIPQDLLYHPNRRIFFLIPGNQKVLQYKLCTQAKEEWFRVWKHHPIYWNPLYNQQVYVIKWRKVLWIWLAPRVHRPCWRVPVLPTD